MNPCGGKVYTMEGWTFVTGESKGIDTKGVWER